MTTDVRPPCQETVYRPGRLASNGHRAPATLGACPNRARYRVTDPQDDNRATLLCGIHANITGRWARYPDLVWEDLP